MVKRLSPNAEELAYEYVLAMLKADALERNVNRNTLAEYYRTQQNDPDASHLLQNEPGFSLYKSLANVELWLDGWSEPHRTWKVEQLREVIVQREKDAEKWAAENYGPLDGLTAGERADRTAAAATCLEAERRRARWHKWGLLPQ